jgi:hypothetical protein
MTDERYVADSVRFVLIHKAIRLPLSNRVERARHSFVRVCLAPGNYTIKDIGAIGFFR